MVHVSTNPPNWLSQCLKAGDDPSEWDSVPILSEEVKNQLNQLPGNSAPGLDRLPYKVWKPIDPSGSILAQILEICIHVVSIKEYPSAGRRAPTSCSTKRETNRCQVIGVDLSAECSIYKIYAALWAEIISPCQKGFMMYMCLSVVFYDGGCLVESQAVWFDLFRSIPHDCQLYD